MSSEENQAFIKAMIADFHVMNKMVAGVDVTTSEATNPADLDQIMTVVKQTIGVDKINGMVLDAMRDWMLSTAKDALLLAEGEDYDTVGLKLAMGSLYRGQGIIREAEKVFKECVEICEREFAETHPQYIESMDALANCYYRQEKYELAEVLLKKCLENRRTYFPDRYEDLASSIGRLSFFSLAFFFLMSIYIFILISIITVLEHCIIVKGFIPKLKFCTLSRLIFALRNSVQIIRALSNAMEDWQHCIVN